MGNKTTHHLVKEWRAAARRITYRIKHNNFVDQTSRVIMAANARTLRDCAKELAKEKP